MPIVEGYRTNQATGGSGQDSWVSDLRQEARREAIRNLTLSRIKRTVDPSEVAHETTPTRMERIVEGLVIGVGVALFGALVCSWMGVGGTR